MSRTEISVVTGPPEDRPLCDDCGRRPATVVLRTADGQMELYACAECVATPGAIPELRTVTS